MSTGRMIEITKAMLLREKRQDRVIELGYLVQTLQNDRIKELEKENATLKLNKRYPKVIVSKWKKAA